MISNDVILRKPMTTDNYLVLLTSDYTHGGVYGSPDDQCLNIKTKNKNLFTVHACEVVDRVYQGIYVNYYVYGY